MDCIVHRVAKSQTRLSDLLFHFSFRIDWFDLLAVQGTRKSLLQHHNSKASILWCSALWYNSQICTWLLEKPEFWLYGPLSAKWYLLFKTLYRFFIAFLTRSKCLLISWMHSRSTVILEPKKIKTITFYCFPVYLPWSDGTRYHDLSFLNVEL